ncbi:hypothetical protein KYG_02437 [Acidovorax sp. NO-1]|uniref:hypothetical protein n=1 Tax=Acidovorax sp. NO-1 TaxID=512030 RepID=UPI00023FCDD7|nr:hypothetical protein [Acidovorax sp. NO-1]EHL24491.1 hypothetical protein KYG_02437 [Acidovorax sp. NO-1]
MMIRPTPVLLAVNAALALGMAALWFTPEGQVRGTAWTAPAAVVPEIAPPSGIAAPKAADVSRFLAVLERPLFSPNRRPPPPPAPTKADAPPEPDPLANIQLQGVYSTDDGGGGIFARVDGKDRRIAVGTALGGWTVRGIDGLNVTFAKGEDARVVRLVPAKLGAVAAAPTLPGAVPPAAGQAPAGQGSATADPVLRQKQEQEERTRARLERMNAARAANGLPPLPSL